MATNTTNYGLSKPAGSDNYDVGVPNGNMDKIDTALQGLGSGIAIVATGNTHAAIASGQFVYVHGHGTLAEGLYTANSAISANATLSSSNLTACSNGAGNALLDQIGNFGKAYTAVTAGTGVTIVTGGYMKIGHIVFLSVRFKTTSARAVNDILFSGLPSSIFQQYFGIATGYDLSSYSGRTLNGNFYSDSILPDDTQYSVTGIFYENI